MDRSPASLQMPSRRDLIRAGGGFAAAAAMSGFAVWPGNAHALPPLALVFPRDRGSHPDFRTEWWYITGHATSGAREFGFQLTFFRSRVEQTQGMKSAFAAKQLVFAHAAITDVQGQKLWHDQRIAREGFGVASASEQDMALKLRDWSLQVDAAVAGDAKNAARYTAVLPATDFALDLRFQETQPLLLQGSQGLSRKGPEEAQASYYYSQPQLAASGRLRIGSQRFEVTGKAWLDHEWSRELLHPKATGWDWIGMNLDDGSALTAFHLRDRDGGALWDGGSFRDIRGAGGEPQIFKRGDISFTPVRSWKSPLTQTTYPVEWTVRTPIATYTVRAVIDNQELDSRQSTGAIYWEGLSDLLDSSGKRIGRGYLEMTGYASPLRL